MMTHEEVTGTLDIVSELLRRNHYYLLINVFQHMDFHTVRTCLWVSRSWRQFVLDNMERLNFEDKERQHNKCRRFACIEVPKLTKSAPPWKLPPMENLGEDNIENMLYIFGYDICPDWSLYNEDYVVYKPYDKKILLRYRRDGQGELIEVKFPPKLPRVLPSHQPTICGIKNILLVGEQKKLSQTGQVTQRVDRKSVVCVKRCVCRG